MANNSLIAPQQTPLLNSLYKDFASPSAFTSLEPLWREAIKHNPEITRPIVQKYLLKQHVYTKHRKAVRRFPRLHTFSPGPKTIWQADLGVMSALGSRNRNYNYYLLCIDCFSRMIFVEPIKRKLATDVVDGFEKIFQRAQCLPWKIITDAGREFTAGIVQKYFRKRQISHFCEYTSPNWHAGMAERANRTIRERLYRYFTEVGHRKWVPIIQELVNAVNNSPSRALGGKFTPMDVHLNRKNAVEFLRQYFKVQREKIDSKILKRESGDKSLKELRAGTRVRIENRKNLFQKGFVGNFSDEIFTIDHRRRSIPTTYRLRDNQGNLVKGWFYRHDLSPLYGPQGNRNWTIERILERKSFEKEGQKREFVYVKWKGFDAPYNSWLPIDHVKMEK